MGAIKNALNESAYQGTAAGLHDNILDDDLPTDVVNAAHWWLEFGLNVIPVDKAKKTTPVYWQPWLDELSHNAIDAHWVKYAKHDLGFIVDDQVIVLDADSPDSLKVLLNIEDQFNVKPNLINKTSKGEHHFFKRAPGTYAKQRGFSSELFPDKIDVKTGRGSLDGRSMVVLPPSTGKSVVINEARTVNDLVEVDQDFIDAIFLHNGDKMPREPDPMEITGLRSDAGETQAAEIVSYIDPDLSYDEWFIVMAGLHQEFNGSDIGLMIFDNWSKESKAGNYPGFELIEYKWSSCTVDKEGGAGFGTVCEMARLAGADLSAIAKRYDADGNRIKSFEELLEDANNLDSDSDPSAINSVVLQCCRLDAISNRKVLSVIKKQTGLPFSVLEEALKEEKPETEDHLSMARRVVEHLGFQNVIAVPSFVWQWSDTGVWKKLEERGVRQIVQSTIEDVAPGINKSMIDSVCDLFKTEIFKPHHEFDVGSPECVNTLNGELTMNPNTMEWELKPAVREHYRTTQIPVLYDPNATAPRFKQFMQEVFKGDPDGEQKAQALLEMMGYSLMAHCRHEKFVILVGTGANGKSVLLSVLEELAGKKNVAGVQPSQFDNKFQRAHLHGKLVNMVTEVKEGEVIDDASLKGIVSGEPTTVEHKNKDPFVIRPFSTCWFGANHMPHTRDFSDALFRRALVVEFNNTFKPELGNCDPKLKDKLIPELPGILNMALEAYSMALTFGFTLPESCKQARNNWRLEADQVAQFVDDACTLDKFSRVEPLVLFKAYQDWARDQGIHKQLNQANFSKRLVNLGFERQKSNGKRYICGLNAHEYAVRGF